MARASRQFTAQCYACRHRRTRCRRQPERSCRNLKVRFHTETAGAAEELTIENIRLAIRTRSHGSDLLFFYGTVPSLYYCGQGCALAFAINFYFSAALSTISAIKYRSPAIFAFPFWSRQKV